MVKGLIIAGCALLVACATPPAGDFCMVASPMRPSAAALDTMSDREVADMLAHNRKGAAACNWQP